MGSGRLPVRFGAGLLGVDGHVRLPDGRTLRTMTAGAGPDLVALETGLGFSGLAWGPVHAALARRVRVLAYERAGFGDSSPDEAPRDLARLADDLDRLVDAHPHRRLVLVGHSWGGPIVRVVAARRLARGEPVAGVLLVDPSDEFADLYFGPAAALGDRLQIAMLPVLARLGLLRPLIATISSGLPQPYRDATAAASGTPAAARAAAAENRHVATGLGALRLRPERLDGADVVIVSGQRHGRLDARSRAQLNAAHAATAARLRARVVPAHASGHLVPLDEPRLIAQEAVSLVEQNGPRTRHT